MRPAVNGEVLLEDENEMWLRPTFPKALVDRGVVGREAFLFRSGEPRELSGVRDSVRTPQEAESDRLNRILARGDEPSSGGTWGVTVGQLTSIDLQCFDDTSDTTKSEFDLPLGHAFLDMMHMTKKEASNKSHELAEAANKNGCLTDIGRSGDESTASESRSDTSNANHPV